MSTNRRTWIKQSGLALAGLSIFPELTYSNSDPLHLPPVKMLRLNGNENPYGPSPKARKAMSEAIIQSNRYPFNTTTELREKIAAHYSLTKDHVLMGAGSSEILGLVTQYAALQKGNAVTANPTFGIWWTAAEKMGMQLIKVPLTTDKKHDLSAMLSSINEQTRLVYVCNPNNPTGTVLPAEQIKAFIETVSRKTLVLLDEAYTEYSDEPTLSALVQNNKNLVIAKTFSKIYGMAGARIGYALAHPDTIAQLKSLQPWENASVSMCSVVGAMASIDDREFIAFSKSKNREARELMTKNFDDLGIAYIPSHSNYVYFSAENFKGDLVAEYAKNNIRAGRITEEQGKWTRITVGTPEEIKAFNNIITKIWNQ